MIVKLSSWQVTGMILASGVGLQCAFQGAWLEHVDDDKPRTRNFQLQKPLFVGDVLALLP